ncbi:MAG: hypothetical protein EBX50_05755 [Chitinophagia bacterium]|nr:hypothetical protein [Chitinophagia bacterium]
MATRKITYLLAICLISAVRIQAQVLDAQYLQSNFKLQISKTNSPILLDGEFNEPVWKEAAIATSFHKKYPSDIGKPQKQTYVQVCYDSKFIYFAVTAWDSGKALIQSLKRDMGHDGNDGVGITLDPGNEKTTGFFFTVNAFNAQSDDQLKIGDEMPTWSWDCKWFSETKIYKDRWTAEIAIPFKSIRYSADKLIWGINFVRSDPKSNEYSTWTPVPVNFKSMNLGFTGALIWKEPPPEASSNYVFLPYLTGGASADKENGESTRATFNGGFDGKWALTSSLNLDVTVNPDFSQVEVDQQVTNLTRFNIFLPERRTFFLENADLFAEYGIPPIRPFYSRKIGLDPDGNRIPIIAGARVTGNISGKTRIGFMDMQTGALNNYRPENYMAASINHRVLKRSVIKAYMLNRENLISSAEKQANPLNAYGRNAGTEWNYINNDGKWNVWAAYHHSFKQNIADKNQYIDAGFMHTNRHWSFVLDVGSVGTNYYTDMGFVARINNYDAIRDTLIRMGFKQLYNDVTYRIFPEKGKVVQHVFKATSFAVVNPDYTHNETNLEFKYTITLKNTGGVELTGTHNRVSILYPTAFTSGTPLPIGNYDFQQLAFGYQSDMRKKFNVMLKLAGGEFYNGHYQSIRTVLTIRHQPHINIALQAEYNKIQLPGDYGSTELILIAPRFECNFNTRLFWTTFVQYNTQRNNFNINSRLQYRFRPMSDLYVVYTDNYFITPVFNNRNRALVFKLSYWIN